jgi:hypothetical protein
MVIFIINIISIKLETEDDGYTFNKNNNTKHNIFSRKAVIETLIREVKTARTSEVEFFMFIFNIITILLFYHVYLILTFGIGLIKDLFFLPVNIYSYFECMSIDVNYISEEQIINLNIKYNESVEWWKENGGIK